MRMVNGVEVLEGEYFTIGASHIVFKNPDSTFYRLNRITDVGHKVLSMRMVDDFWTLPDAVQGARHDAQKNK